MPLDLHPGQAQTFEGVMVVSNDQTAVVSNARCEIVQHEDGTAHVDLLRYTRASRAHTDRRRVPLAPDTFLALADALFSPVESDDRLMRVRAAAVESGRYAACPKCRGEGWAGCVVCHGKAVAPVDRIEAFHEARRVDQAVATIEVPWDPSTDETENVILPTLWLSIRAVIDGDGDAPALVNVAAIPKPTGPVKLAVVPADDGGSAMVNTLTMPRETYLAFAAALAMCVAEESRDADDEAEATGDVLSPDLRHHFDGLLQALDRHHERRAREEHAP